MRINSLTVTNFGIFLGTVRIELNPIDDRNIILIGGQNGSGKTTLLEAIRLALYGSLAFGLRYSNADYLNYIREHLNIHALTEGVQDYSVGIELELKTFGNLDKITITRRWNIRTPVLKETVEITRNNIPLTPREASDFTNYLSKMFPPSLLEFFFFDGERLHEYFRGGKFEDDLRASALTLFNLDLFATLSGDLKNYLRQNNVFDRLPEEEKRVSELEARQQALRQELQTLDENLECLEKKIQNRILAIKDLEQEFRIHGGLWAKERIQLQTEIGGLEEKKRALHEWIREVIADIFPFFLVADLLKDIKEQIHLEEEHSVRQTLARWLSENRLRHKLAEFLAVYGVGMKEDTLSDMVAQIHDLILPPAPVEDFEPLHLFSAEEKSQVIAVAHAVENFLPQKLTEAFEEITQIIKEIQTRRKALEESINNESLAGIIQQIRDLYRANEVEVARRAELSTVRNECAHRLEELETKLKSAHEQLAMSRRDENIFRLTNRVSSVVNRFVESQMQRKTKQLSTFFAEMISTLMRKEGFIEGLIIEPGFNQVVLHGRGGAVPKHHLSAGEKQIYILALVWAMIKTSQKEIPLLFDTLIGRLDKEHRGAVIDYFLPRASVQTIVFATDTEIDWVDYQRLRPHIAREYVMEFNQESLQVEVYHGYFFGAGPKGGRGHIVLPKQNKVEML